MDAFNAQVDGVVEQRADAGRHVIVVDMSNLLTTSDIANGDISTLQTGTDSQYIVLTSKLIKYGSGYNKMAVKWYESIG